jgi:hypothetical protein
MKFLLSIVFCSGLVVAVAGIPGTAAQDQSSRIFVNVVLVQLNVAVTDHKGQRGQNPGKDRLVRRGRRAWWRQRRRRSAEQEFG